MRTLLAAALMVGCVPMRVQAQDSTAMVLQQARDLYERIELERALPLYRAVLSPGWRFDVSQAQRVEANLYLGAALILLGVRDSAVVHFRAALERDPFADLDPSRFTPTQLDAFQAARQAVFRIGVRPVVPMRLDPRTRRMTFTIAATHEAAVRAEIRLDDRQVAFPLFLSDLPGGLREIEWDGVLPSGQLAPSGRYAFVVLARSRGAGRAGASRATDSTAAYFDVRQEFAALEDTLPDLGASEVLAERYRGKAAAGDLLKGLGVAAGALFLANVASNRDLGRSSGMATAVAAVGVAVGVTSFATRRGRARPENVAINERRRAERATANDEIRRRNAARLAETILVITPAAGRSN